MAIGQGALIGDLSYLAFGREVTYGTYVTGTSGLNFLSCSFGIKKELKILEEIQTSRTNSNYVQLGKTIEGDVEFYFSPINAASNYLLHNAFGGGPPTTATATGDTAGATTFTHTINIGNFDTTYSSLSLNIRKGDSASGKIFQYQGLRVNEFSLSAELDDALKASASLIAQDATTSSNDVASSISTLTQRPLSFVNGRFSIETSTGALTTTSFWHTQKVEFSISNNLVSDSAVRRIGSDVLAALPAGLANFELKCSIRFDTTTALSYLTAGTRLAGEFQFEGDTMSGSTLKEGIKITFPYLVVQDAGDPEIGGPNEILTSEVSFGVLRDPTSGGYAVRAVVTNNVSSYA